MLYNLGVFNQGLMAFFDRQTTPVVDLFYASDILEKDRKTRTEMEKMRQKNPKMGKIIRLN
jgi:hypothetical protein